MNPRLVFAAVACALAAPAFAQPHEARHEYRFEIDGADVLADAADAKATAEAWRHWGDGLRASLGTMFGERYASTKVVRGAPYSAEVSTEVNRTLADGNVISRKTTGRVHRDGMGRTRQETVVNGKTKSIQIGDPVAGTTVMLLPESGKAVRLPSFAWQVDGKELRILRLGDREIRIEDGKVSLDGKEVKATIEIKAGGRNVRVVNGRVTIDGKEISPGRPGRHVTVRSLGKDETGDGTRREEVTVQVLRGEDGGMSFDFLPPVPPAPPAPPALPGASVSPAPPAPPAPPMPLMPPMASHLDAALLKAKATTTSLGEKEFEHGVKAEGKSTVRTIPAGEIGNRDPIRVSSETWYSPRLKVTVFSRQSDPRHGETIYRLTDIRTGEPSPELFKVPAEYGGDKRGKD